jgi:hypothetical protein
MFVHPPVGIFVFFFRGTIVLEERTEICSSIKLLLNKPIYLKEYKIFFSSAGLTILIQMSVQHAKV